MERKILLKLAVLVGLCCGVGLVWRTSSPSATRWILIYAGYWMMLVTVVATAWCSKVLLRSAFRGLHLHYWGLAAAIAGSMYLHAHEPTRLRILGDEFNMSGVARNMHFLRTPTIPVAAHFVNGGISVTEARLDKRPFLFPFLISTLHDVTGYRLENVFALNFALTIVLLLLLYAVGCVLHSPKLGFLLQILAISLPLLAQTATSGGYDLLNLVMIMAFIFAGAYYLENPTSDGLNTFIGATVLLAQVRNESILYVIALCGVVLFTWIKRKRVELTWCAVFSPIALLSALMVLRLISVTPDLMEVGQGRPFLDFAYFSDNFRRAIYFLFNTSPEYSNSLILSTLGSASLVGFIVCIVSRPKQAASGAVGWMVVSAAIIIIITTFIILNHFWGQWDDAMAARLSLPFQLLLVLSVGMFWSILLKEKNIPGCLLPIALVVAVVASAPVSATGFMTTSLISAQEHEWLRDEMKAYDSRRTLTIVDSSAGLIIRDFPAIALERANTSQWKVAECLKNRMYDEILVMERFKLSPVSGKEVATERTLAPGFVTVPVAERHFRPNYITRISRIVGVKEGIAPPASYTKEGPPFENDNALIMHLVGSLP